MSVRLPTALAALTLLPCQASTAAPSYACTRAADYPGLMLRQADLPPMARAAMPFQMADPGQAFQVTDVVINPHLPGVRLICAYPENGGSSSVVVEWESGGIAHRRGRTVLRRAGAAYVVQ